MAIPHARMVGLSVQSPAQGDGAHALFPGGRPKGQPTWGQKEMMMTDDEMPQDANDQPDRIKPEQVEQQEQQSQTVTTAQPDRQPVPGRRPLFRS